MRPITIYKGDDTAAFRVRTLRIVLDAPFAEDATAVFSLLSFSKTFTPEEVASNDMRVEMTRDTTSSFPLGVCFGSFKLYDATGLLLTSTSRIPFVVKNAGTDFQIKPDKVFIESDLVTIRISFDITYAALANKPTINGVVIEGDKKAEEYGIVSRVDDAVEGNFAALTQDGNLVDSGKNPSDYYTAEQTDEAIDRVAAYYITYDAAGNPFPTYAALANAQTVYSGGEVRAPTRNDYCVVLADETHQNAEYRYIYAVAEGETTGEWQPQFPVEGVIAFDNAVTPSSANGVKSSGIWSAIWGALSALPTGFSSLYDWVVDRLAGKLDKSGGVLTPIYEGGSKYSDWICDPVQYEGQDLEVRLITYPHPVYDAIQAWRFYIAGTDEPRSDSIYAVDGQGVPDDAATLAMTSIASGTFSATRTANPIIGYTLGSQTNKVLQAQGDYAVKGDATLTERGFGEWEILNTPLTQAQKEAFYNESPLAAANDYAVTIDGVYLYVGNFYAAMLILSNDELSLTFNAGSEEAGSVWGPPGTTVATRTVLQGYQLGSQADKPLASEAEAVALRRGKADKPATFTTGNLAALDANGNPTDSGIKPADKANTRAFTQNWEVRDWYEWMEGDWAWYNGLLYRATRDLEDDIDPDIDPDTPGEADKHKPGVTNAWVLATLNDVQTIGGTHYAETYIARKNNDELILDTDGLACMQNGYGGLYFDEEDRMPRIVVTNDNDVERTYKFAAGSGTEDEEVTVAIAAGAGYAGNLASLDANGNSVDSGISITDVATKTDVNNKLDKTTGGTVTGTVYFAAPLQNGQELTTTGTRAHAEGFKTKATGSFSHSEGDQTTASAYGAHSEGYNTIAGDNYNHAEGFSTRAYNVGEHASGIYNVTHYGTAWTKNKTYAVGDIVYRVVSNARQYYKCITAHTSASSWTTAEATYWTSPIPNYKVPWLTLFSVGCGQSDANRKNAVETMQDGKTYVLGIGGYDGTNPDSSDDLATVVNRPVSVDLEIPIIWSDLKALRDGGNLVPGQSYRITDYVATVANDANAQSANHPFDIIVVADDERTLNEHARAMLHEGDTYFAPCNLAAWDVWYCLDNDTDRFAWADTTNGKGVIYRLVDEFLNDCPYDFKGIQFKAYGDTDDVWRYTFDSGVASANTDYSLAGFSNEVYKNMIGLLYDYNNKRRLNRIVFKGTYCHSNILGPYSSSNTFGPYCSSNTLGPYCSSNTFGPYCTFNTLGPNCGSNTFGSYCSSNTLGPNCGSNTLGPNCDSNTLGSECYSNKFGSECYSNTFGTNCTRIIFGTSSSAKSYCRYIHVCSGNQYLFINPTGTTSGSQYYQNVEIKEGVNNTTTYKTIDDPNVGQTFLTTYKPADSQEVSL